MYFPFASGEIPDSDSDDALVLTIAVVCEDLASALRAEDLFAQIKRALGSEFQIQITFWRFAEMEILELRERASVEFAAADMIVISYRAEGPSTELPGHLQDLLLQKSTQPRALVTLDPSGNGARCRSARHLRHFREASTKAGLDFFSEAESSTWQRGIELSASAHCRSS